MAVSPPYTSLNCGVNIYASFGSVQLCHVISWSWASFCLKNQLTERLIEWSGCCWSFQLQVTRSGPIITFQSLAVVVIALWPFYGICLHNQPESVKVFRFTNSILGGWAALDECDHFRYWKSILKYVCRQQTQPEVKSFSKRAMSLLVLRRSTFTASKAHQPGEEGSTSTKWITSVPEFLMMGAAGRVRNCCLHGVVYLLHQLGDVIHHERFFFELWERCNNIIVIRENDSTIMVIEMRNGVDWNMT